MDSIFMADAATPKNKSQPPNLELQLLTKASNNLENSVKLDSTQLQLSIGSSKIGDKAEAENADGNRYSPMGSSSTSGVAMVTLKDETEEQLRAAMAERAHAEEAREQAKSQRELAEQEFANAKRIRKHAVAKLEKAQALKEQAAQQLNATILQITCHLMEVT